MAVLARLNEVGTQFTWHEVNGAHAFLRDEGARYDPELARQCFGLALGFVSPQAGLWGFEFCAVNGTGFQPLFLVGSLPGRCPRLV